MRAGEARHKGRGYHTADAGPRCGDDVMGEREGSRGRDSTTTKHAFTASDIMTSLTRMEMHTCHKQGSRGRTCTEVDMPVQPYLPPN